MPLLDLPGAIGPTYQSIAPTADGERAVNLIPEIIQANGKSSYYYTKAPGLFTVATIAGTGVGISVNGTLVGTGISVNGTPIDPAGMNGVSVNGVMVAAPVVGTSGVSAGVYINGRRFFIVNDELYELTGTGVPFGATALGPTGPCVGQYVRYSLAVNIQGNQLLIASNNVTSLYDLTSSTFHSPVTTPETLLQVDECDGYFIGLAASGKFYISNFQDGLTWNPLDFAFEETPDLTMGFKVCNRRVTMFGSNHIESYVDSGDTN